MIHGVSAESRLHVQRVIRQIVDVSQRGIEAYCIERGMPFCQVVEQLNTAFHGLLLAADSSQAVAGQHILRCGFDSARKLIEWAQCDRNRPEPRS